MNQNDTYEIAELYIPDDVPVYIKHGWVLLDVKNRPWRKGDDDSCPVIFVMGKEKSVLNMK